MSFLVLLLILFTHYVGAVPMHEMMPTTTAMTTTISDTEFIFPIHTILVRSWPYLTDVNTDLNGFTNENITTKVPTRHDDDHCEKEEEDEEWTWKDWMLHVTIYFCYIRIGRAAADILVSIHERVQERADQEERERESRSAASASAPAPVSVPLPRQELAVSAT